MLKKILNIFWKKVIWLALLTKHSCTSYSLDIEFKVSHEYIVPILCIKIGYFQYKKEMKWKKSSYGKNMKSFNNC